MFDTSLSVAFPATAPFDRADGSRGNWYDSFLGNVVRPVYETGKLDRFWFSHYGQFPKDHHAKFRFSTEHFAEVHSVLEPLITRYSLTLLGEHNHTYPHPFDIINDLVAPNECRHFGTNQRNKDRIERGHRIYEFVHAAAVLTLHCLSHEDSDGRWYREDNLDRGNNHFGDTMEAIHHLLCNLSEAPTAICVVPVAGQIGPPYQLMSPLYSKMAGMFTQSTQVIPVKF